MSRRRNPFPSIQKAFGDQKADYNAARASQYRRRRTGVPSMGSGADYHYRSEADYLRMMELARDMDRNDVVAGQALDRAVTNTVQTGFTPDPQTPDPRINALLMAKWRPWATDPRACDRAARLTFSQMEWLVLRHCLADGDHLPLPLESGQLQLMEGHRLRTPRSTKRNVVHGVLMDGARKPLEYWFTREEIDPLRSVAKVGDIKPYPAWDEDGEPAVLHVYNPKRVSQTRGVTAFAPLFDTLGMVEDINFAELVKRQIASFYAILREQPEDMGGIVGGNADLPGETETVSTGSNSHEIQDIAPGMEYIGGPGEKLSAFNPNIPGGEFFEHMGLELQLIGINLVLPLVLMLMDARETNFSGWRGAVDQARLGFKWNQHWLKARFHAPVWRWKVRQWIQEDRELRAAAREMGEAIFAHTWNVPSWPYIEPLKDAQADSHRIKQRLISPRRQQAERGLDWDQTTTEIVEDHAQLFEQAIAKADELNRKFPGARIDWRELVGLDPKGRLPDLPAGRSATDRAVADEKFRRDLLLAFAKDQTLGDILYNAVELRPLAESVGLRLDSEYTPPWSPVTVQNTQRLISGEAIENKSREVVSGDLMQTGIDDAEEPVAGDSEESGEPAQKGVNGNGRRG